MFIFYALLGIAGGLAYARIPLHRPALGETMPTALGPSRRIVYKLAVLFSLDAFAGGFVVQSLLALWLFERAQLDLLLCRKRESIIVSLTNNLTGKNLVTNHVDAVIITRDVLLKLRRAPRDVL